ncbi:unnamed protein product [Prunus armeniaca]|uniref:Uncharacterized protein n=1 Tax=Prunus armeniaca TaxID=36596 RepID=A0A6J5W1N0_PRUAR|nr:unnamed protein product [Prunus armeniaca]
MKHKAMVCWCVGVVRMRESEPHGQFRILEGNSLCVQRVVCRVEEVVISGFGMMWKCVKAKARRREKVLWAVLVVLWMLIAMSFFGGNGGSDGLKLNTLELA